MEKKLEQKAGGHFLLKMTPEEKKRLHIAAAKNNTTMSSLVKYLMTTNKTLDEM